MLHSQPPQSTPAQIQAEQVHLLYTHAPAGFVASLVNAGLVAFILRHTIPSTVLASWLIALIGVTAWRASLVYRYRCHATPITRFHQEWKKVLMRHGVYALLSVPADCMAGAVGRPLPTPKGA